MKNDSRRLRSHATNTSKWVALLNLQILIYTGRAPTKRTLEMICLYMSGWASMEELKKHIEKLRLAKK